VDIMVILYFYGDRHHRNTNAPFCTPGVDSPDNRRHLQILKVPVLMLFFLFDYPLDLGMFDVEDGCHDDRDDTE
jgi:hypothetical protein